MTFSEFTALVERHPAGVILLEGRRTIAAGDAALATSAGKLLATRFPHLRFRSGNAEGTDEAFAEGVAGVDPTRLQIVAPYASHRKRVRYPAAHYDSPETMSLVQDEEVAYKTITASPQNKRLIEKRADNGRLAAKAAYLIRDTMKVTGHSAAFPKPICALFHIDPADPMDGGTGHTVRLCAQEGVPYVFQTAWHGWLTRS